MRKKTEEDFLELKVMVMFLYIMCIVMIFFVGHRTGILVKEVSLNTSQQEALTQMYFRLITHVHERHENDKVVYTERETYDLSAKKYDNCKSFLQEYHSKWEYNNPCPSGSGKQSNGVLRRSNITWPEKSL